MELQICEIVNSNHSQLFRTQLLSTIKGFMRSALRLIDCIEIGRQLIDWKIFSNLIWLNIGVADVCRP